MKEINYEKPKKISATKLRDSLFTSLDDVYLKNETLVVEKSGIPIAYIVSPKKFEDLEDPEARKASFLAVLEKTRGIWKDDADYEMRERKRRKLELSRARERRKVW